MPANALTFDFEEWYHGIELPPERWREFDDRLESVTGRLLDLLHKHDTRATFFVLGDVAERQPNVVRALYDAGHEIATHGLSHEFVYRLPPEQFQSELRRSIELLEDVGCGPVRGHRAPYFSITKESLWAFDALAEAGIRYDSSVFPVVNYRYGIPDAPRWPYQAGSDGNDLIEFPISTWRIAGRNLPIAGGAYFRILPYAVTRRAFKAINRSGHSGVFYLHPWELDPDHPKIPLPRRISLTHYANLRGTERRLRRLLDDFAFAPMQEVLGVG